MSVTTLQVSRSIDSNLFFHYLFCLFCPLSLPYEKEHLYGSMTCSE